jgi:hypothetical protein
VLLAREVINRGTTYLIAPNGTVSAGDAGVRASGDLFVYGNQVVGAPNFSSGGMSSGVPATADSSGISVSGVGSLGDAAKAASDATSALAGASEDAQKAANDMKQSLASFKPNLISVEVLGYGAGTEDCASGEDVCRKQKQGGS